MELGLELVRANALSLREHGEGEREDGVAGHEDKAEVDGHGEAGPLLEPLLGLQADEDERGDDHDGRGVEDAGAGGLADGDLGCLFAAA